LRGGLPVGDISPQQAFSAVTILHLTFSAAVLIYVVTGEIIAASVEDLRPGGFVDLDNGMLWIVRGFLAFNGAIGIILAFTVFGDDQNVPRMLGRAQEVTDATVAAALQTGHILRLAFAEAIAIYGLVLFQLNGHRYDLYGFAGVALAIFVLSRPSRDRWEGVFRTMSLKYPSVSSSPWQRTA
jgi:hypothetical protein